MHRYHNRNRSLAILTFNVSNVQAPPPPPPPIHIQESKSSFVLLNTQETNVVNNNTTHEKEGWLKQRKRYFKKWKRRYARIEQSQYFCTYQSANDDLINCVDTIDLTKSKINYTLDKPKQFVINTNNLNHNDIEHSFECATVSETNDWLIGLKQITASNSVQNTTDSANGVTDLDLVTKKPISSRVAIYNENQAKICIQYEQSDVFITDMEINDMYMKAVSAYQHKHYEECESVINSVLHISPNHKQAAQLHKYSIAKKYNQFDNKKNKSFKKRKWMSVSSYNGKKYFENKKVIKNKHEFKETEMMHRCQIEFKRFLIEKVKLSQYYKNLNNKFICVKYNDIRFMKDFDKNMLEKEIGLRPLHCSIFMRKIKIFMNENKLFKDWLKQFNDINDGIIDSFENNGIMTFGQLHRYIKTKRDLEIIMKNANICDILWMKIEKIGAYEGVAKEETNMANEVNNEGLIVETGYI